MLRSNLPSQSDVRSGDIHRGQHSGHRTNPNGAGPWHFAVKTMLILYGIQANDALFFVLIVHSVQTLLVVLLGIYAWIALAFTGKVKSEE